ncbi:MAG: fimbrial protein [Enterobacter hormaechei]
MKGKVAAVALITTLGMVSAAQADDGQVNFTGNIIEQGCKIDTTMTAPQTVKLGDIAKTVCQRLFRCREYSLYSETV